MDSAKLSTTIPSNPSQSPSLRKYIMQNQSSTNQLYNEYNINTNKIKATLAKYRIQALEQITQGFFKYVFYSALSVDNKNNSGQKIDDGYIQAILDKLKQSMNIKGVNFRLLLGTTLMQSVLKNQNIKKLKSNIEELLGFQVQASSSSQSDSDIEIQFEDQVGSTAKKSNKKSSEYQKIDNFYARETDIQKSKNNTSSQNSKISLVQFDDISINDDITIQFGPEEENYNSDFFKQENLQVKQYLYKLSKSTTQLSYLCQRMKWSQPTFQQDKSKINQVLFSCIVKIDVRCKNNFFELSSVCPGAVSKRQAKRTAALYLLRKIYNRMPEVWKKYKQCREKNPTICIQLNANNQQIFKKANFNILQATLFKQQKQKTQTGQNQIQKKIKAYLDKVPSYKSQMNVLIGKYKKISPPNFKPDKQDQLSLWPVQVEIYDDGNRITAFAKQASKKKAQQVCCKELLYQIFCRNVQRWMEFVKYKEEKKL